MRNNTLLFFTMARLAGRVSNHEMEGSSRGFRYNFETNKTFAFISLVKLS